MFMIVHPNFQEEAKKKQLKVKIQMAKFLQDTVEEMAVSANKKKTQEAVVEFANFFEKVRPGSHNKVHVLCDFQVMQYFIWILHHTCMF